MLDAKSNVFGLRARYGAGAPVRHLGHHGRRGRRGHRSSTARARLGDSAAARGRHPRLRSGAAGSAQRRRLEHDHRLASRPTRRSTSPCSRTSCTSCPGLRVEPYITSRQPPDARGGRHARRSASRRKRPRSIRASPSPIRCCHGCGFKAAFGIYHQSPQADGSVAGVRQSDARHLEGDAAGSVVRPSSSPRSCLSSRWSSTRSRTTSSTRSLSSTPPLAQALVQEGEGRAYGAQILLRQELTKRLLRLGRATR